MLTQIKGIHHVTSIASSPQANNDFFTNVLGLRRVKKTVNFDAPDVYHLYYGNEVGSPGTVMTYFPFPGKDRGRPGVGEIGCTSFAVPKGSLPAWRERLSDHGAQRLRDDSRFGEERLVFDGPDGDSFALVATDDDREPWTEGGVSEDMAIRGFHSAEMRVSESAASAELLTFMGYEQLDASGNLIRFHVPDGDAAQIIDVNAVTGVDPAAQGAGSVHHIAFAVENRARQLEVREALTDAGYSVTPVIDRDYFWAIYFRTPDGILFEVATNEPGFATDEDKAHLGEALKLPSQHAHLRSKLERTLEPIGD